MFSARTVASLQGNKKRLLEYLKQNPDTRLSDIGYTTTARRMHGPIRSAFSVATTEDLVTVLEKDQAASSAPGKKPKASASGPNVVFVFTGQGSQYAGMAGQLFKHDYAFRSRIESFQRIADALQLPNFVDLIINDSLQLDSESPVRVQLAVCAIEIALSQLWMGWGLKPVMVMGHSLGEYAALCCAGVLTVSDTLYLVGSRATIMEKSLTINEYAMLAVGTEVSKVRNALHAESYTSCEIACLNGPNATVVSGRGSELNSLKDKLVNQGIRSTLLQVPFGFHSKQLQPVLDQYEACAQGVVFAPPNIPIASTLLGEIVLDEEIISPVYLRKQAREPVNFMGAFRAAQNAGVVRDDTIFVELGPDAICSGLLRANLGTAASSRILPTIRKAEDNWATTTSTLAAIYQAGISVNWPEYHKEYESCLSLLQLPTYAFDEKDYWTPYPNPGTPVESAAESNTSLPTPPVISGFPTTTLQRVAREVTTPSKISITFESSTAEDQLFSAIQGHAVVGVKICSSAVFADMALSATQYAYERLHPGQPKPPVITICELDIHRAIVVMNKDPSQIIEIQVDLGTTSNVAQISFRVRESEGVHDVGTCEVVYDGKTKFTDSISSNMFLVKSRINSLKASNEIDKRHRLLRSAIYRLFSNLVDYGEPYKGLDYVSLDTDLQDAIGEIKMPASASEGNYLYNPFMLDATVHLSGFIVNCGLKYPSDAAFLSTGFDAWHLLKPLLPETSYTSYAFMEDTADNSRVVGNVYVFDDMNEPACIVSNVRFQRMKKTTLTQILMSTAPKSFTKSEGTRFAANQVDCTVESVEKKVLTIWDQDMSRLPSDSDPSTANVSKFTTSRYASSESSASSVETPSVVDTLLSAVAREAGCDISELEPDTPFMDLGVDSLMAITVIASIRREIGVELPGSFFLENPTVADAVKALGGKSGGGHADIPDSSPTPMSNDDGISVSGSLDDVKELAKVELAKVEVPLVKSRNIPAASTMLLQRSTSSDDVPLFLIADGTGSVSSYVQLLPLAGDRRVYGVESPFSRDSSTFSNCTVEELAESFTNAIRTAQSTGPYMIGGFQLGAIYAFEVSKSLIASGETVLGLVIGSSPAPSLASAAIQETVVTAELVEQSGLVGGGSSKRVMMSPRQKEHLVAVIGSLLKYEPREMGPSSRPKQTILLSPTKGLGYEPEKDSSFSSWIHANWATSQTFGWESLVGDVEVASLETDSFSMLKFPHVCYI